MDGLCCLRLLVAIWLLFTCAVAAENGGWSTNVQDIVADDGPCNIESHDASSMTQQEFVARFAYNEPVILRNFDNSAFRELCTREKLIEVFGDINVKLSSANTYSYKKVPVTVKEYLNDYLRPQTPGQLGNETMFLFGDINPKEWAPLLDKYIQPPWKVPKHRGAVTFGVAGAGTGVPFHFHGPAYGDIIYGRKRWFLYPPEQRPNFDPDVSTLEWFLNDYPKLEREQKPLECIMKPGELIYFPDRWWHATLNVETAVFVSTFLSP